jgi:geranylgeranyl reductase family protein
LKTFDVAVVGAGPAGGIAATLCARSGLKTVLVEKKKLPRFKSCAGGLTARCIRLLRDINCFNEHWVQRTVNRLMIHYPQTSTSCELNSHAPYLGSVNRPDFDMALVRLADEAGAEIRETEFFIAYQRKPDGQVGITTNQSDFSAKVLIGADGYHSRVRRQMMMEMGLAVSNPMMLGIECDILMDLIKNLSPEHCHLFFNVGKGINYGWAFPKKHAFNVGLVLEVPKSLKSMASVNPLHHLKLFLQEISGENIAWHRVAAAPIPLFGASRYPLIQNNNVLLIGDAAGLVDAWTGEGIYFGVKSAVLAHQAIQKAFVNDNQIEWLSSYAKLCHKFICRELSMSCRVSEMFKKFPSLYDYLAYPKVRQLFVPHTQGKISYQKALVKAFLFVCGYKIGLLK